VAYNISIEANINIPSQLTLYYIRAVHAEI